MSKNLTKKLEDEEWYKSLIEDCQSLLVEGIYNYRLTLIRTYHLLGRRILEENDNFRRAEIYGEKICQRVGESLGKSRQTIQYAVQFANKYPDLDKFIDMTKEQKVLSWHKIVQNYLPEPRESKIELPKGKYQVIYADPPWQYDNEGFDQSAEQKYSTMPIKDICEMPVKEKTGERAVLFLWATNAFLKEAISVCESWGFEYKTNMAWIKNKGPTIGWFTKSRHELLLIATKGEGMHPKEKFNSWFKASVGRHSEKPKMVYGLIEKMYDGPYLELFLRGNPYNKKWQGWGYEMSNK